MARTAIAPRDEFLPAIFRRRQLAIAQAQDPANPNLLAPPVQPAVELAPLNIVPTVPTLADKYKAAAIPLSINQEEDPTLIPGMPKPVVKPVEESNILAPAQPMVSRSGQVMNEDATRARRVETNKDGRPVRNIALSGNEQTLDYNDRLASMPEDKEGGGWWPKIRAAIGGFAAGGPVGAAAAFGTRALREHMDPTLGSREYRAQEMGQLAPAVDSIRKNRKDQREEARLDTQNDYTEARTKALTDPKTATKWVIKQDEKGVYRPVNPATGMDPDGKPVKGKMVSGNEWEIKVDSNNRYVPVNKRTGLDQNGKPVTARSPAAKDVEDVTFGNQQIERAISEAQAEQKKIDGMLKQGMPDSIPRMIEGVDPLTGVRKQVSNPDYTYNMTRRRQLDDDIRNWRIKQKAQPKKAATASNDDNDPLGIFDDE